MRIVFFGCDNFAAINLLHLIGKGHKVVGLVTQPDKPKGRGLHMLYAPTKQIAMDNGIAVFQPDSLKDPVLIDRLRWFHADIFIVIAYGKFLPPEVLALPKYFCVNVHASLLPKYRGAAPVNWAIMRGEAETGVTIMKMDPGMDTGDIIAQASCAILDHTTSVELRLKLADMGKELLSDTLPRIKSGDITLLKQDNVLATRAPKMHKDLGHIRWDTTAKEIHDLVRGVQPWPGAFTFWHGKRLKILEAEPGTPGMHGPVGQIVLVRKEGFCVQASDSGVLIKRVHPESSHAMDARAFLAGHKLSVGEVLG